MASEFLGTLILWSIAAAIVIAVAVLILRWLYRRSTKDTAFVRTGFLGEKVVINGGAFVIPVLHEITPVNMNVMRIEVRRNREQALITKNRMRVDLMAEFFVKVGTGRQMVAAAAQTLGRRTLQAEGLRELLEGKFASAMRTVAAQMTLVDMHERLNEYATQVKDMAAADLAQNGLELESVAIVDLDQTSLEFFNPSNAFDAEGLTQLTESIELRRRMRNEIEQRTQVDIRNQNLDAQRKVLEIDRESEYARLEQEREIEVRRAVQRAELSKERALRDQEAEQAQYSAREMIEKSRLHQERSVTEARIKNEEDTQRLEIARRRALDEAELKSREQTEHEQISLELSLEKARIGREREQKELEVQQRRTVELAELEKQIALAAKDVEVTQAVANRKRIEIESNQQVETSRVASERELDEIRLDRERALEVLQIAKRRAVDEADLKSRELTELGQISLELVLERARIGRDREQRELDIGRRSAIEVAELEKQILLAGKDIEVSRAIAERKRIEIETNQLVEASRILKERELDQVRLDRERILEGLQISKRKAVEEAEILAGDEIERARITINHGLEQARLLSDRDLKQLAVERDKAIETAELQKSIEIAQKSVERSDALVLAEAARAKAVEAEEKAFTAREREIAERRKLTDFISTQSDTERDALRLTSRADAEMRAAGLYADTQRITAQAEAEAEIIRVRAAAERYEVDARGQKQIADAENTLSEGARRSRFREKLLDKIEGIVRESVKPMEKIESIKILHVDGMNGGSGGNRNVTDEVIDSALRYRVQAPMIDNLMKDIGIETGGLGRMTEVLRDAKDIASLTKEKSQPKLSNAKDQSPSSTDDERDR